MKLTDYLADRLSQYGVTAVFGMSGGAAVHMFDSFSRHPKIHLVPTTHEQAAAMAADGYSRATGGIGVAISTSGPGATNLLTGVCCSFYDSVPTLILTGQVATHRLKGDRGVRQIGFQETDVVGIFAPVTKFAVQLQRASEFPDLLEEAIFNAFEGRPGPVLIDIPDDLQRAELNIIGSRPISNPRKILHESPMQQTDQINQIIHQMTQAERPLLVLGGGLKTPYACPRVMDLVDGLGIPILVTWAAIDLIPYEHPLRIGTFGVYGSRAGNFAVQNSDLILALGTRLSQNLTGGVLPSFARGAKIVLVDVDEFELSKFDGRGIEITHPIKMDLHSFVPQLVDLITSKPLKHNSSWRARIEHWKDVFGVEQIRSSDNSTNSDLDATEFVKTLSGFLPSNANVYVDTGGNLTWTCNALKVKVGQNVHSAWNFTPMGYALPAAIGGAIGDPSKSTVVIIGDGGLMLCLGELATLERQHLPLKVFLFNNMGHGIQKQTLETWLDGHYVGVDYPSGLGLIKDWSALARANGLSFTRISDANKVESQLQSVFQNSEPQLIEVVIDPSFRLYPYLRFGMPLEEQSPSLDRDRISEEMLIKPYSPDEKSQLTQVQGQQGW